jgi:hypothetical protein
VLKKVLQRHNSLMFDLKLRRLSYKAAMDVSVVRARNAGRTSLAYWSPEKGLLVAQGRQVTAPRKLLRVGMIEVAFLFVPHVFFPTRVMFRPNRGR